jgi:hypothetical protein
MGKSDKSGGQGVPSEPIDIPEDEMDGGGLDTGEIIMPDGTVVDIGLSLEMDRSYRSWLRVIAGFVQAIDSVEDSDCPRTRLAVRFAKIQAMERGCRILRNDLPVEFRDVPGIQEVQGDTE